MSVLVHVNSEIDTFLVEENGDDDREEDRFMYAAVAPLLLAASVAMVSNALLCCWQYCDGPCLLHRQQCSGALCQSAAQACRRSGEEFMKRLTDNTQKFAAKTEKRLLLKRPVNRNNRFPKTKGKP